MNLYGMPQPLTGNELVTIHQEQNGQLVKCTMKLSQLVGIIAANFPSGLSTTQPATAGVVWNDNGVVSIS